MIPLGLFEKICYKVWQVEKNLYTNLLIIEKYDKELLQTATGFTKRCKYYSLRSNSTGIWTI